ncbi:MAG: hypothetical protein H7A51_09210 [Akkermansiaceae bacterium]|nr:hypothetical protein [Akkermansiaceae bacterium]
MIPSLLAALSCFCICYFPTSSHAEDLHRGVWFWNSSSSPYGAANVVGDVTKEIQTVDFMTAHSIKRVYGSYQTRTITEPAVIAAWNTRLSQAGISSQFLLAEPTWVEVDNRPNLLTKITDRVVNYNTAPGRLESEKFDAIHLDIEPQQLAAWDAGDASVKRDYLTLLLDTYTEVRAHLDAAGLTGVGLYADLPVWFDKLPADGGSVGWADAADRDAWFAAIGVPLSGVSLMAFERDSFSNINGAVSYERSSIPGATVRTAVQAKVSVDETWDDIGLFIDMQNTLEVSYGSNEAVDIENYRLWREALDESPVSKVGVALEKTGGDFQLNFATTAGGTYVVQESDDLVHWKESARVLHTDGSAEAPVIPAGDRTFWRVYRFDD